ncbi:hypothetical protein JVU11DRAFT_2362 [Chiua virens]|nr:hypothetical protein JVU11DRAFT_2362 [Chiua virens]
MPSGVDDTASNLSRYSMASTNVSHITANIGKTGVSDCRPAKRRRVAGLNTRFDRMIKSVNTLLSYRTTSPAPSRKRVESSGTSSTSSHDIPKTPVDSYSNHLPGKLGKDFSLLKTKNTSLFPREHSGGFHKLAEPPKEPLPGWLANTFCSLEAGHPLRGLLSPSRVNRNSKCNSPPRNLPAVSHEEEIFAFSHFDKQEEVPDAAYRAQSILDVSKNVSSAIYAEPALSNRQLAGPASLVPFSTPGRYASVRVSGEGPIAGSIFQELVVSAPQRVTSQATDMTHPAARPPSPLRLADTIERPQFARTFSNLIPANNDPPSKFQELGPILATSPRLNVYATPGPTFACSRPVYFDSPTEDPSLSDSLDPESYELDLNAIDFRWRPFLRSGPQEKITVRPSISPSSPLGHAISNQAGDQSGWNTRFAVDQGGYGASSEELPSLAEDLEIAYYLDDASAIQPSNVNMTSTISNLVGPWSSPINNVLDSAFTLAPGVFLSPLRDQPGLPSLAAGGPQPRGDGENIDTSEKLPLLPGLRQIRGRETEPEEGRPSTPIKQFSGSVPPPRAPQKVRSSQLCGVSAIPVRKTASALSWMIPLKSSKRTTMVQNDVNYPRSHVTVNLNSHDSIESWGK